MGDLIPLPVPTPWRRWLLLGGGVVVVAVVAFTAGRFSAKPKVIETVRVETRQEKHADAKIDADTVTTVVVDRVITRYVRVATPPPPAAPGCQPCPECPPIQVERIREHIVTGTDEDVHAAASSDSKVEQRAESVKVTESAKPGWAVAGSVLWTPLHLSQTPTRASLEVDRRLFGTFWLGAVAHSDLSTSPDVRLGATVRLAW